VPVVELEEANYASVMRRWRSYVVRGREAAKNLRKREGPVSKAVGVGQGSWQGSRKI
jgi:hypothetical protein